MEALPQEGSEAWLRNRRYPSSVSGLAAVACGVAVAPGRSLLDGGTTLPTRPAGSACGPAGSAAWLGTASCKTECRTARYPPWRSDTPPNPLRTHLAQADAVGRENRGFHKDRFSPEKPTMNSESQRRLEHGSTTQYSTSRPRTRAPGIQSLRNRLPTGVCRAPLEYPPGIRIPSWPTSCGASNRETPPRALWHGCYAQARGRFPRPSPARRRYTGNGARRTGPAVCKPAVPDSCPARQLESGNLNSSPGTILRCRR